MVWTVSHACTGLPWVIGGSIEQNLGLAGYSLTAQQENKDCLNSSLCFMVDLEGVEQETFDGEESSISVFIEN